MNFNEYTIKSQEAIQKAAEIALGEGQQAIESAHILQAIAQVDENVLSFLIKKLNINKNIFDTKIQEAVSSYPKVTGQQPYLSNDAHQTLTSAKTFLKTFGDEYVSIEHLLLGILKGKDKAASIMKEVGFVEKDLIQAIKELRGGNTVTDQHAEGKYRSLEKYSKNLNELAKQGKIDPVIGRDEEIRRVLQILSRRTKNNPILLGEPGVGKTAITDVITQKTPEIAVFKTGILHLHILHTSAALSINENADPTVRKDFTSFFDRLVPENEPYFLHTDEGPDDMPAHIKASLLGFQLQIPLSQGKMKLGTWQGIYLCEFRNHGGRRKIWMNIVGDEK